MDTIKNFLVILEQLNEEEDFDSGTYYAEYSIDPKELELCINVKDCGNIPLPISNDIVQKMLAVTTPARFGLRDQTIYDKKIRDTNEISADKINISYNVSKFSFVLDNIRNKLGLPKDTLLEAHLHNILLYSKNQFFAKHQDTEKLDGMLATLIMVLPSPHIGGTLTIKHQGREVKCKSENINSTDVKFIAFYSDCQHKVQKIVDGYRVVATYNLIAKSTSIITAKERNAITKHRQALKEAILSTLEEQATDLPCITYLLNHQYTKHGLSWSLLRGVDRLRVELIKSAAMEADCEVMLALIEARETWTTEGGYGYGDSNEGEEPQDLVDSEIDVVHAIDMDSKVVKCNQYVTRKALCYHLPNDEFEPSETEYEGYMGNYGNTVDYWYHRAAIIIWRKSDSFVFSFLNDPNSVVKELVDNITAGIYSQLEKLWPYWSEHKCELIDLRVLLELAILVNEPDMAAKILQYCSSSSLTKCVNDSMCKLFAHYGRDWAVKTLDSWFNNAKSTNRSKEIYDKFSNIIQDFVRNKADDTVINRLIEYQINRIKATGASVDINKPISLAKSTKRLVRLMKELIEALQIINDVNTEKEVLNYITSEDRLYPALELIELLQQIKVPDMYLLLKNHILSSLYHEVMAGLRNQDDWSIDAKSPCACEYCRTFNNFMSARTEISKRWPIKQDIRSHIMTIIQNLEVPIDCGVEAKGSPHKLLLTKSNSIHMNAKIRFEAVCSTYQKLLGE